MKKKIVLVLGCVLFVILSVGSVPSGDSDNKNTASTQQTKEETKKEVTYEKVSAKEMIATLEKNALKAKETYKDKYVEITGVLGNIDAQGAYIGVDPSEDAMIITGIQAYVKSDEQKKVITELSKGDKITVKGKVTDVGEVIGYSVDIAEISKTQTK